MKKLPRWSPLFLLLALAWACQSPRVDYPDTAAVTPDDSGPPFVTIEMAVRGDSIVITPDSTVVPRGQRVAWRGADQSDVWVVVFAGPTPMNANRRVINGGGPGRPGDQIAPGTPLGVYKYWVFYPTADGDYLQKDPKLVIVDN